ncbi:divergent polysaccharide deacetylase family protein [Nannocystis sp.]|uniref:divergent polysaccharide deacetylase family protein n=1 Tax=Nannocystis sp. TaxID=1962667 RepID=UPI002427D1C2|nr:divergent polysaccharide deacetylase family protein [Nannocystis sp.]MBK7824517.1 divergent polysaccharide deacetylase family protein [Nannocystis sp.]MBK9753233.1 divergent polysaccharide deacetylase family protein [Nannocystis sp.]
MRSRGSERRDLALRLSLALWVAFAGLMLLRAPPPPSPPVTTAEAEAIFQRTVDQTVEKARLWQDERGDQTIAWDQARGHLAIVIDDVGRELHLLEQLHALRFPLTFSVLPGAVYAAGAQLRLRADRRRYREILLHLPCEPEDPTKMLEGREPEEHFLRVSDPPERLRAALRAALDRVPAADGVNNHMGSRFTADRAAMDALMPELQARGLFFLDSQTTANSRGLAAAAAAGVPTLARDVFLDVDPAPGAVLAQLERAAERARDRPTVIIAHPSPAVVEVLRDALPRLHREGIGVYPLRELLTRRHASPGAASSAQ